MSMTAGGVVRVLVCVSIILATAVGAFAQEAVITGKVTDSTGGVLPGVTVTAVHEATGIDFQMVPASLQESVTVTAEAPLVDVHSSTVGANLDSKQLSEIPLSGRNFLDLVMLAPGSRANEIGTNGTGGPVARTGRSGGTQGTYQMNIDGQQVTATVAG